MVPRYAVIGSPVRHSKSPRIHAMFAEQCGESMRYDAIEVGERQLAGFVSDFFAEGGAGLNVTLPHKQAVFQLAGYFGRCSKRAALAQAVNTLLADADGKLTGDNTDGCGLVRDLTDNHGFSLKGKAVLILGAGGAGRGALPAILEQQPGPVTLLNRTLSRAQAIQADFAPHCAEIGACIAVADYDNFSGGEFDLIINATSLSLSGEVPPVTPSTIAKGACCYDMMYGDSDTPFVSWAKAHGAELALDGLGMLVEQAAESFYLWRGVRPQTGPVIAALRN